MRGVVRSSPPRPGPGRGPSAGSPPSYPTTSREKSRRSCPQPVGRCSSVIMMTAMDESPRPPTGPDEAETQGLIDRAIRGDQEAWGELLARHRDRLRRMVALRLDRRL